MQPVPQPWTKCPDGVPYLVCLNRENFVAIRANQKTALAEKDRMIVDETERREKAEAQRDAANGELTVLQLKAVVGGSAAAVVTAGVAVLLTLLMVRR